MASIVRFCKTNIMPNIYLQGFSPNFPKLCKFIILINIESYKTTYKTTFENLRSAGDKETPVKTTAPPLSPPE